MMAKSKSTVPIKLQWREDVLAWVNDNRRALPPGVGRVAAHAIVGMVMQSAQSDGRDARVSARWLEREAGVNHTKASELLKWLVRHGWLSDTEQFQDRVRLYDLVPSSARSEETVSALEEPDTAERNAECSEDEVRTISPPLPTTDHREPSFTKEKKAMECGGCGAVIGHRGKCQHRPFGDSGESARFDEELAVWDSDVDEYEWPSDAPPIDETFTWPDIVSVPEGLFEGLDAGAPFCEVCDQSDGSVELIRNGLMHRSCAPAHWRKSA